MTRLRLPGATGRRAMAAAAVSWCGVAAGWVWGLPAAAAGAVVAVVAALGRRWIVGALVVASIGSGWAAAARVESTLGAHVPEGPIALEGVVVDEPVLGAGGFRFVLVPTHRRDGGRRPVSLPPVAVVAGANADRPTAGDTVIVRGSLRSSPGRVKGDPVAGRIVRASIERAAGSGNPMFVVGNALRRRVATALSGGDRPAATSLLRGFLIGDTSGLEARDTEALRRSGLTHFVAVSGSNVALFLAGWWLLTAPVAGRPRVRAVLGLVGLGIFVVVTRWEPSVMRAAAMAGLVLGGRLVGVPLDAWTALGAAATGLLLLSGDLATSVGFQLSVFATAGVLAGAGLFSGRRPVWLWTALGATMSAQLAVAPLLLVHFGTIPLLSPVANMAAVPLVTLATVLGGVGVVSGWSPALVPAIAAASGVLHIARLASGWPQLGITGVAVGGGLALLARWRRLRPLVGASSLAAVIVLLAPGHPPRGPTITFLDVGQGDAVLLQDGRGIAVLVDGGRDPRVLDDALRRHGVQRLDLIVATHGDADHAGGLEGIVARTPTGRVWVPDHPDLGPVLPGVLEEAERRGVPVDRLRAGAGVRVGDFSITPVGPVRRYASPNDGSIVLWVEAGRRTALLPGDIEAVAQRELPALRPDILLVPHHGSSTTDIDWLKATVGHDAVVSVGDNPYGHPSPVVLEALAESGTSVWVTMEVGDVSMPLN